jgi:hypothetical protein
MRKIYVGDFLAGEEMHEKMSLQLWVKNAISEGPSSSKIYSFLSEAGKYFNHKLNEYPTEIPRPAGAVLHSCHENTLKYAALIYANYPHLLQNFEFVSGVYGIRVNDPYTLIPYAISNHSFLTYKGAVLDCTSLEYASILYEADEYYGVAFEIPIVMQAYKTFCENLKENESVTISLIEILLNEPYLK